jgi:hypothetical protein
MYIPFGSNPTALQEVNERMAADITIFVSSIVKVITNSIRMLSVKVGFGKLSLNS